MFDATKHLHTVDVGCLYKCHTSEAVKAEIKQMCMRWNARHALDSTMAS